jgi:RimJ/RimL family protein N-acetyltransferase
MNRPILLHVPTELMGERILVRRLRDEDAPEMHVAIQESREHIRPWLPWADMHPSVDDTIEFIRRTQSQWALRESFGMGIFALHGQFLGGVGIHPRNWQIPSMEIGYWISKGAEGNGYVTEATKLVTGLGFECLKAQRIMIRCDARNVRSKAVPERLGYTFEGTMRHDIVDADGVPRDSLVYSLIPEEYEVVRTKW